MDLSPASRLTVATVHHPDDLVLLREHLDTGRPLPAEVLEFWLDSFLHHGSQVHSRAMALLPGLKEHCSILGTARCKEEGGSLPLDVAARRDLLVQSLEAGAAAIDIEVRSLESLHDVVAKAKSLGIPVVPGSDGAVPDLDAARRIGAEIGYPVIIKATAGGGGRGMKVARNADEMEHAFRTARSEAKAAFGNDEVYIEKYLTTPRHIELQVFGDGKGGAVHLGERDCSLQRRHQKVFEEAPGPCIPPKERDRIGRICADAVARINYIGAGTIEFLYENGAFYFIEMNTRLQVEHPVTETIFGVDLVREQIRVAEGLAMSFTQDDLEINGHAIEVRINAERLPDFTPCPGRITHFHAPGGLGVRMDSALYDGYAIPPYYDSLIGKLIVHGRDRPEALARLNRALGELIVDGIDTTIPLFRALLAEPDIQNGTYNIHWLERWLDENLQK